MNKVNYDSLFCQFHSEGETFESSLAEPERFFVETGTARDLNFGTSKSGLPEM